MGKVPWSVAAFLILLLFAVRTAAQAGACGPQPINPCATYECVAGHWKVSPRVGACTVGGQSGTCEAGSCAVVGAFKINVVVYGLSTGNSLVLLQGNSSKLSVTKNGSYSFPGVFGQPYSVTVQTQPAGQSCAVGSNGSGNLRQRRCGGGVSATSSWTPDGPHPSPRDQAKAVTLGGLARHSRSFKSSRYLPRNRRRRHLENRERGSGHKHSGVATADRRNCSRSRPAIELGELADQRCSLPVGTPRKPQPYSGSGLLLWRGRSAVESGRRSRKLESAGQLAIRSLGDLGHRGTPHEAAGCICRHGSWPLPND